MNALLNVDSWRKEAYGLGPIITEKVKQVLNTPYRKKENGPANSETIPSADPKELSRKNSTIQD